MEICKKKKLHSLLAAMVNIFKIRKKMTRMTGFYGNKYDLAKNTIIEEYQTSFKAGEYLGWEAE